MPEQKASMKAKQSLSMSVERWDRFRSSPGWYRDKFIAVDYFKKPYWRFEVAESVITEPFVTDEAPDVYFLSMLVNSDAKEPMVLDFGHGPFIRPNVTGSLVFGDFSVPMTFQGQGPYHLIAVVLERPCVHERILELFGESVDTFKKLYATSFHDNMIANLLRQLLSLCRGAHSGMSESEIIDSILGRLLLKAGRRIEGLTCYEIQHQDEIQVALNFIHEKYSEPIYREELARLSGLSDGHFARVFHRVTGTTFGKYLKQYRLSKARELLVKLPREVTIHEISRLCGYADKKNFYSAFVKEFKMTPGSVRMER